MPRVVSAWKPMIFEIQYKPGCLGLVICIGLSLIGCTAFAGRMDESSREIVSGNITDVNNNSTASKASGEYETAVNKLLLLKPQTSEMTAKVWTDKKVYRIGEKITFSFRSDKDAYITLVDVGTSGDLRIIFPNSFAPDNLVKGGQTYLIPADNSGFSIRVDGPPGIEHIKIIATQEPILKLKGDWVNGFGVFRRDDRERTRAISAIPEQLKGYPWTSGSTEIEIRDKENDLLPPGRDRTIKPGPIPPEKPVDIIGVPGMKPEQPRDKTLEFPGKPVAGDNEPK